MLVNRPDVYPAIADPNRRRLLELLSEREHSVQELLPHFNVTIGAVSQHLKILHDNGLVARRKQGRYRLYRTRPESLKEVHEWCAQFSQFWEERLESLGTYLENRDLTEKD